MKKYFTKYIRIEGEIKEGDKCLVYLGSGGLLPTIQVYDGLSHLSAEDKKVKLFLCSSDIQVGDEVYNPAMSAAVREMRPDGKEVVVDDCDLVYLRSVGAFKAIGKVSLNANWVTEGMEFNDNEVALLVDDVGETNESWFLSFADMEEFKDYKMYRDFSPDSIIGIKCPYYNEFR